MQALTSDPTLWANALMKAARLFGLDGVVVGFDFTLMAEACGCDIRWIDDRPVLSPLQASLNASPEQSGRIPHALETAGRLPEAFRSEVGCVAALTGPVTLAGQLFGEEGPDRIRDVKPLLLPVVEAFCAARPDALLFLEDCPAWTGPTPGQRRIYNTLKNIASHYNVCPGLYLQGVDGRNLGRFSQLNMDIYLTGPAADGLLPPSSALWDLGEEALGVGLGVPLEDPERAGEILREARDLSRKRPRPSFFVTGAGPVTRDTDPEALRRLADEVLRL